MFSITRDQFIEAALAETERLRTQVRNAVANTARYDQEQIDWWMIRIANVQFAIEHLHSAYLDASWLAPSEMRALMEILYG